MQEINRLKQLRDQIVGIEMHLSLIQSDLIAIDGDIKFLEDLALVLTENIEVLKSDKIIAVASEYKRAVAELKTVNQNLKFYIQTKVQLVQTQARHEKIMNESLLEFEELKKHVDNRKIILLFDQTKRKNK